jgi:hypothetical protein
MSASLHENTVTLSSIWLKAAVAGGLWASVEIIAGSLLHNLRLPLAGGMLASFGMMLMIAFYRMWPERGLIWRAGLICALMKSISPSAVIFGPMIGIMAEALLLDLLIRLLGKSLPALMFAGGVAVLAAFGQKLFNILIIYGFSLVRVYLNLFDFAARQIGFTHANPWVLIFVLSGVYFSLGMAAGISGYIIGKRTSKVQTHGGELRLSQAKTLFGESSIQRFSTILLAFNLLALPAGILLINKTIHLLSFPLIMAYISFCLFYYPVLLRRLKKPLLWVQLVLIIFLSAIFWETTSSNNGIFDATGLMAGVEMAFRAMLVISAFTGVSVELRSPLVRAFLYKRGLKQVYGAVSLAFQALPAMLENAVRPRDLLRRPLTSVAMMLASAGKWEKTFEKREGVGQE